MFETSSSTTTASNSLTQVARQRLLQICDAAHRTCRDDSTLASNALEWMMHRRVDAVKSLIDDGSISDPFKVAACYEDLLNVEVESDTNADGLFTLQIKADNGARSGNGRKARGIYYTPRSLVEIVLAEALDPVTEQALTLPDPTDALHNISVYDPACGCGNFLVAAVDRLAQAVPHEFADSGSGVRQHIISPCIHGSDIDEGAVELCNNLLIRTRAAPDLPAGVECLNDPAIRISCEDPLLTQTDGASNEPKFDVVVGNPPFIDSESMCRQDPTYRRRLSKRYSAARGNWDLSCVFVEYAIRRLKPGGRMAMVVPRRMLSADYARAVQKLLLSHTITAIHDRGCIDQFAGTGVEVVVIALIKQPMPMGDHLVRVHSGAEPRPARMVPQSLLCALPPGHWSAVLTEPDHDCQIQLGSASHNDHEPQEQPTSQPDVLDRITIWPSLGDHALVSDGAATGEAYELRTMIQEWPADTPAPERHDKCVRLINTGTIDPYRILWDHKKLRYLKETYSRPVVDLQCVQSWKPTRAVQAQSPKILIAGLAHRVEAIVDEDGTMMCGKSAVQIIPPSPVDLDLYALAAYLNSDLFTAWYKRLFGARRFGRRSLHIGPRQLARMPIPPMLATAKRSSAQQSLITNLASRAQSTQVARTAAANPSQEGIAEIEQLVLNLVELSQTSVAAD